MRKLYSVGCVVTLDEPQPMEWLIDTIVKEESHERSRSAVEEGARQGVQSFATLKVLCHEVTTKTHAMMRIYYQIPWTNTDREEPDVRAAQAATLKPDELVAYQVLNSDPRTSKFTPRLLGGWRVQTAERMGCSRRGFGPRCVGGSPWSTIR